MTRKFILVHDLARQNAKRAIDSAPVGYEVLVREARKSRDQEERYHAMIGDIADQWKYLDRKWDAESMKRLLVAAFKEDTKRDEDLRPLWVEMGEMELVPGIRGGFTVLGTQTRRFPKRLATAFIEWLFALGAELEIAWSDPKERAVA
jgi:hypothetical protein